MSIVQIIWLVESMTSKKMNQHQIALELELVGVGHRLGNLGDRPALKRLHFSICVRGHKVLWHTEIVDEAKIIFDPKGWDQILSGDDTHGLGELGQ